MLTEHVCFIMLSVRARSLYNFKNTRKWLGVVVHSFNPSNMEAQVSRSLGSKPVLGQQGLLYRNFKTKTKKNRMS